MSSWSELPQDLLFAVAERIRKLEDFIAFGAVCKRWFAVGKMKDYFKGLWLRQGTPYLMLPVRDDSDDVREFYSLVEDEIVATVRISKFKQRKCHESLGWLLAIENEGTMCLLNPFTSVEILLPHQSTFPKNDLLEIDGYAFVRKFVLSARPSETSDFIVMIIGRGAEHLGFWRPGDESWNKIELRDESYYSDVMYYGGHFYTITVSGTTYVFTLEGDNPPNFQILVHLVVDEIKTFHDVHIDDFSWDDTLYILKTSKSLLMISRTECWWRQPDFRTYHNTVKFRVHKIGMSTNTWTEIDNVGSMAIFVGHNTTFAIDTSRSFGKIKGNHIYFTDDGWIPYHLYVEKGGGKDMGVYNMETETVESFYSGELLVSKVCLPIWITPSF